MSIKSTRLASFSITLGGLFAYILFSSYSAGITGQSISGCGGGGCHGTGSSSGTFVSVSGVPGTGWTASTAYTVTITVTNAARAAAGFNLSVSAGTLSGASTGASATSNEARHTAPKTMSSGSATWTVTWTAPASGTSAIFYLAGNAVNLSSTADAGDSWNTTTQTYNAASTTAAPTITPGTPTAITNSGAKLNASVNAKGLSTAVTLDYGLTATYGSSAPVTPTPVTGTTATAVSATLTGLAKNTTYHYRFTATNSSGTTNSPDATFKTTAVSVANTQGNGYKVYPNPVKDILIIDGVNASKGIDLTIRDAAGRSVSVQSWQDGAQVNIMTSGLASGMYMVRLHTGGQEYVTTFIKD